MVRTAFDSALHKIKAVLSDNEKIILEKLDSNIEVFLRRGMSIVIRVSSPMIFFRKSSARHCPTQSSDCIDYVNAGINLRSATLNPLAFLLCAMARHLIAWCRLRNDYRNFRWPDEGSENNKRKVLRHRSELSLQEYFKTVCIKPNKVWPKWL